MPLLISAVALDVIAVLLVGAGLIAGIRGRNFMGMVLGYLAMVTGFLGVFAFLLVLFRLPSL